MTTITVNVKDLIYPTCGAKEMHPNGKQVLIRGFKVYANGKWRSQCLVCSGAYDSNLEYSVERQEAGKDKGWF
jgi:hypothetical protein